MTDKMVKVRMATNFTGMYNNQAIPKRGEEFEVDEDTANKWFEQGVAVKAGEDIDDWGALKAPVTNDLNARTPEQVDAEAVALGATQAQKNAAANEEAKAPRKAGRPAKRDNLTTTEDVPGK